MKPFLTSSGSAEVCRCSPPELVDVSTTPFSFCWRSTASPPLVSAARSMVVLNSSDLRGFDTGKKFYDFFLNFLVTNLALSLGLIRTFQQRIGQVATPKKARHFGLNSARLGLQKAQKMNFNKFLNKPYSTPQYGGLDRGPMGKSQSRRNLENLRKFYVKFHQNSPPTRYMFCAILLRVFLQVCSRLSSGLFQSYSKINKFRFFNWT